LGQNNKRFHEILQELLGKGLVERSKSGSRLEHNLTGWLRVFLMEAINVQTGIKHYLGSLLRTRMESDDTHLSSLDVPIPASLVSMYILKQMRRFFAPFIYLSILEGNINLNSEQKKYIRTFFGDKTGKDVRNRTERLQRLEEVKFDMQAVQDLWASLNSSFFPYFVEYMPTIQKRIENLEKSKDQQTLDQARRLFDYKKESQVFRVAHDEKLLPTDLMLMKKFSKRVSLKKIVDYAKSYKSIRGAYIRIIKYGEDCLSWTFVMPRGKEEPTIFIKPEGLFLSRTIYNFFSRKRITDQLQRVSEIITRLSS